MPKVKASPQSRPQRKKLSAKESLKRMREFSKRKGQFVAAVRTGKNRSVPA
jgi:hypothetical protein